MKHSNDIAYLRQLCCLGLGREILIPEILKAVQSVIPSGNNFFIGINQDGKPSYYLTEMPAQKFQDCAAQVVPQFFTSEKRSQVYDYFNNYPAITDHSVLDKRFFQTDLYHLMWQPWRLHHFILAPVIVNRQIAGMFFLFRPVDVRPFSKLDQALCLQLLPYIAHALQERKFEEVVNTNYLPSGQSSMVIADRKGVIAHLNAGAKKLLTLAAENDFDHPNRSNNPTLPPALIRQCRNLDAMFVGKDVPAQMFSHTNHNGRFIFRAYWLDQVSDVPNDFIGVTIEHQEPITLKITRNLQFQPLSAKEKEVALMWAQNYSTEQISRHLQIKTTTVKYHVCNIYSKLDINHKSQLLAKLI
jgi:DNA-binding CsgD family transcriptional regulator